MRPKRKAVVKKNISYKGDDSSEEDKEQDFQDSGSEASVHDEDASEESNSSSDEHFNKSLKKNSIPTKKLVKPQNKCTKNSLRSSLLRVSKAVNTQVDISESEEKLNEKIFSIKDLTEQEKLLPDFLNLSESGTDSEDDSKNDNTKRFANIPLDFTSYVTKDVDESANSTTATNVSRSKIKSEDVQRLSASESDSDIENGNHSNLVDTIKLPPKKINLQHLQEHSKKMEETKKSLDLYNKKHSGVTGPSFDVGDLLAMGEDHETNEKLTNEMDMSDSDIEDLEEVEGEIKTKVTIPKGGIQLVLDLPTTSSKGKSKLPDIEMMMRRRLNRVKKEYQVFMHKVHILCWIAHGNYINSIINHESIMGRALSLIPSEHCYPSNRVNMKYLEQITKWYSNAILVKEDKSELRYKPNKLHLQAALLQQIGNKIALTKKNKVLIFISMLRALDIKCRLVISFKVVPLRPPATELCSLTKKKDAESKDKTSKHFKQSAQKTSSVDKSKSKNETKKNSKIAHLNASTSNSFNKISQLDGADDDQITIKKGKSIGNLGLRKKLSRNAKATIKTEIKSEESTSSSTISYWDKITQDSLDNKPTQRVSHRDLRAKIKTEPNTPESNQIASVSNQKVRSSPRSSPLLNKKITEISNKKEGKNLLGVKSSNQKSNIDSKEILEKQNKNVSKKLKMTNIKEVTKKVIEKCEADSVTATYSDKSARKQKAVIDKCKPASSKTSVETKKKVSKANTTEKNQNVKKAPSKKSNDQPESSKYFNSTEDLTAPTGRARTDRVKTAINANKTVKVPKKRTSASKTLPNDSDDSDEKPARKLRRDSNASDFDFKPTVKRVSNVKKNEIDRRVLSTDDENPDGKKRIGMDVWCEVYVEEEESWISVDVIKGEVHCINQIYSRSTHPVSYIVAWDMAGFVKDLTRRYVPHWNTTTRKLRVDCDWYGAALSPWMCPPNLRDTREDEQLDRLQLDAPLPQTVSEFKNHPLYALKRHLLKFEVIYPPNAITLGFVKNEAVYARECVHVCRSRDTWLKEAKVVRLGEKPYKIVKARPKYDRLTGKVITDLPLEIFGPWQVGDYVPPKAEGGKVPRNPYGNVELFKPCMLPEGTVHLTLPGLNKVTRKLGIDCAPAMVGFDCHSGWTHPVYDGFIICEEFRDQVVAAWEQEQEEAELRAREKIDKRVYGNWRRLIRGLLIRERLQAKYDFQSTLQEDTPAESSKSKKRTKGPSEGNKKQK